MQDKHGLTKESVKNMTPEQKQAFAQEFMEKLGMPVQDNKLKKKEVKK